MDVSHRDGETPVGFIPQPILCSLGLGGDSSQGALGPRMGEHQGKQQGTGDSTGDGGTSGTLMRKVEDHEGHHRGGQNSIRDTRGEGRGGLGTPEAGERELWGHHGEAGKGEAPEKLQLTVNPKVGWPLLFVRCCDPCSGDSWISFLVAVTAVW